MFDGVLKYLNHSLGGIGIGARLKISGRDAADAMPNGIYFYGLDLRHDRNSLLSSDNLRRALEKHQEKIDHGTIEIIQAHVVDNELTGYIPLSRCEEVCQQLGIQEG